MTSDSKLTVGEWSESPNLVVVDRPVPREWGSPTVIGFIGTLLLHSLVLQSVVLGNGAQKRLQPERQMSGSKGNESVVPSTDSLVFVDLSGAADANANNRVTPSMVRALNQNPVTVKHPDAGSRSDVESQAHSAGANRDSSLGASEAYADHARLLGIYSGQIRARVERIWERPRTPVNERASFARASNAVGYFQCHVRIVQDPAGNVQAIFLPHCNGSIAWQNSLRIAIQRSSPLPAPPSPKVFSRVITLSFIEHDSIAGETNETYEMGASTNSRAGLGIAVRGVDQSDKKMQVTNLR